jgi:hypothetical protein
LSFDNAEFGFEIGNDLLIKLRERGRVRKYDVGEHARELVGVEEFVGIVGLAGDGVQGVGKLVLDVDNGFVSESYAHGRAGNFRQGVGVVFICDERLAAQDA